MTADPKLGPDGYSRIAILGTSGTSMALAPFKDPKWSIWACSPGAYPICAQNRSDVWFEPHRWQPTPPGLFGAPGTKPWFSPEFHTFLQQHKGPVFMSQVEKSIPTSIRIPYEQLDAKYGPYHWTSTISYMVAMAIEQLAARAGAGEEVAIGLYGVDMAATEEWAYQRPALQHFLGLALSIGIHVVLPPESDLMRPPTRYGIGEHSPRHIRMLARLKEAEANVNAAKQQMAQAQINIATWQGVIQEQNYILGAWTDDVATDLRHAVSFSGEFTKPSGALLKVEAAEATENPKPAVARRTKRLNGGSEKGVPAGTA